MLKLRSLKSQTIIVAFATNVAALAVIGLLLLGLFRQEITARIHTEIYSHLMQLMNTLEVNKNGNVVKRKLLADTRFLSPFSGYYWQINQSNAPPLRSRSLWDEVLQIPSDLKSEEATELDTGTSLGRLILHSRIISLPGSEQPIQVIVALSAEQVVAPLKSFQRSLFLSLLVVGTGLTLMAAIPLWLALRPLNRLTREVTELKLEKKQVGEDYVKEIQPIATALNRLLQDQEKSIERARGRAADFAHSLKTPLAIIEAMLPAVRDTNPAWALEIRSQTQEILRHVERELARSRSAAGHGEAVRDLRELISGIAGTIEKLPRTDSLVFNLDIPDGIYVRMDKDDATEIIANLLDNARKWATSQVSVSIVLRDGQHWLEVCDDGPGVSPQMISALGSRGLRLDERTLGTGIGLAIVRDLLDASGLAVQFTNAQPTGLRVQFQLPLTQP
jgi:signal transduction histidine kinase